MPDRKLVEWFCKLVNAFKLSMAVWFIDDKNVRSVIFWPKSLDVLCSHNELTSLQFKSACVITLLYGNNSEYWHMSVEFLFISSSNNVIRSGVVTGKLLILQALLDAVDDVDICGCKLAVVKRERVWFNNSFSSVWSWVCCIENVSASQHIDDDVDDDDDDEDDDDDDDDVDKDEMASVGSRSVVESISGSTVWNYIILNRIVCAFIWKRTKQILFLIKNCKINTHRNNHWGWW